jgi:TatD DNase family protein
VIDFHCHLDLYPDAVRVVEDCRRRGLYVLSVTTTPSAWKGTSALAGDAPRIRTALGLHPQIAHERQGELPLFDELLPKVRYVGEIGLDGGAEFRRYSHIQAAVFEYILAKCSTAGSRIMSIHSRRAAAAVLDLLTRFPNAGIPILHWSSGSYEDLRRAIALGCWFSVGPAMLQGARGVAICSRIPRDRVLTETDGPFARINGHSMLPWDVQRAQLQLSKIWECSDKETERILHENLQHLLKWVM